MTHESPKAKVLPLSSQTSDEGVLQIGGCDIRELANEYGTPLYVFDIETLTHPELVTLMHSPLSGHTA